jgi:hypothetical protein
MSLEIRYPRADALARDRAAPTGEEALTALAFTNRLHFRVAAMSVLMNPLIFTGLEKA